MPAAEATLAGSAPKLRSVHAPPDEMELGDSTPAARPRSMNSALVQLMATAALSQPTTPQESQPRARSAKRVRKSTSANNGSLTETPAVRLADMGGIDGCIEELLHLVGLPLRSPGLFTHLGIAPPRGILLHGPPGCGKTMLAHALAGECGVPFFSVSAPSIVGGMSGESEKRLREVFAEARQAAPSILFIDEIDAITPKRETAQREMERRIVAQMLTCMDDADPARNEGRPVIVLGATNRPDSIDPALRRAGRFDREIALGVPDAAARLQILRCRCAGLCLAGDFDLEAIAQMTPGYVGADLNALAAEAGLAAVKRIVEERVTTAPGQDRVAQLCALFASDSPLNNLASDSLEQLAITQADFVCALRKVQPSAKREGFATVPDVTWSDIGALESVRDALRMAVVEPIRQPELFRAVGIEKPMGVLLYGPPGCGKTLLAKAVASESCCNFLSVKGPELLNKYVGESERAIRQVFARAQASAPCVIFFDELDALAPSRSGDGEAQHASRLVNTLLTELDGAGDRAGVFVIAATNRPDMIDSAMIRPGRLDKTLYVDLPNAAERLEILRALSRRTPLDPAVDLAAIAHDPRCDAFSGADLASVLREAAVVALRRALPVWGVSSGAPVLVTRECFDAALATISPSVSARERRRFEFLRKRYGDGVLGGVPTGGANSGANSGANGQGESHVA